MRIGIGSLIRIRCPMRYDSFDFVYGVFRSVTKRGAVEAVANEFFLDCNHVACY